MRGPRRDPRPSCFDKYIDKCNAAPATRKSVSGQRGGTLADTPTITNAVSFSFFPFPPPSSTSSVSCSNLEDKKCWEVTTQINTDFRVLLIRLEPFHVSSGCNNAVLIFFLGLSTKQLGECQDDITIGFKMSQNLLKIWKRRS